VKGAVIVEGRSRVEGTWSRSAATDAYLQERAALLAGPLGSGAGRRRALTALTDGWLAGLFRAAGGEASGASLVAVGSYGRGELSPGSDLDVLLLHPRGEDVLGLAERVWYPVWDSGLRLDHSVRAPADARRVASEDLRSLLSLLDARHVAGDADLADQLRTSVLADWRAFATRRLPELLASCRSRQERFGELAFLVEPDLKEARGGLRDLVVLRAVAASWVADAPHGALDPARQCLLDVRDALHTVTGRSSDKLALQEQEAVAHRLDLLDGDALLREVAQAARVVSYAGDVTWRRAEQAVAARAARRSFIGQPRPRPRAPLAPGVVVHDQEVVLSRDAQPERDPVLALRAAAAAAQAGMPLAPSTVAVLAAESPPMPVPWPRPALDALLALLGAGAPAVRVWEALDHAGIPARLLPDWERVRNRPQRNFLHRFSVDRHLVETAAQAAPLARRVARPDLLLVAALLHDIGKGWPGDHTSSGVRVVSDVAPRLGFSPPDTDVLCTLVRHHLLLPDTATRRDLDDPVTVAGVAAAVGNVEVLELLHALTEADARATGPLAWNEWRASLVADLVGRTHAALSGVTAPPPPVLTADQQRLAEAGELAVSLTPDAYGCTVTVAAPDRLGLLATVAGVLSLHRLEVRAATTRTLGRMAVSIWSVRPEFGGLPDVTVLREELRRAIEGTLDVAERLARREQSYRLRPTAAFAPPRVAAVPGASATATVLEVRAHDRPGLLHRVGSVLAAQGVDVTSARVSTLGAEVVDVFYVVGPDGRPLDDAEARRVGRCVRDALR
jgi:[protein-PII] uridylyltransferase